MTLEPIAPASPASVDVDYWTNALVFAARVAEKIADTEFVSPALRGRPDAVAATILYGAEVGVTPMAALQGIHIVEGRPAPSSELMRALIYAAGHTMQVHEASGTRVRVSGLRRGRPETERVAVEWTLDMARAAGLLGRRNWQTYPRAMLMARASGDLARILFPDVIKGLGYVAEETATDDVFTPLEQTPPASRRRAIQRAPRPARTSVDDDTETSEEDAGIAPAASPSSPGQPERLEPDQSADVGISPAGPARSIDTPDEIRRRYDELQDVPLPELEPEETTPEEPPPSAPDVAPPAPRMVGAGPLKAIHTGLGRELGTAATREEKHALVSAILGRDVESVSERDVTRAEGFRVLDYLDRFNTGAAAWQFEGDGSISVHDLRLEPDEPPPADHE